MTGVEIALGVAALAAVASTAVGTASAMGQADAEADMAKQTGRQRREAALLEERKVRREAARVAGAQRAGFGASGVTLEGSPLELLQETAAESELDALSARYSGEIGVYQARAYRAQAKGRKRAALIGGGLKAVSAGAGGLAGMMGGGGLGGGGLSGGEGSNYDASAGGSAGDTLGG